MTDREISKQVRNIVFQHYDYWHKFNDLRAKGSARRLKFMKNGHIMSAKRYKLMSENIISDLREAGIKFIDAGFKSGTSEQFRSDYVYFYVVLPVSAK